MFTRTIPFVRPTLTVERLEDRLVPNRLDFGLRLDIGWELPFGLSTPSRPHHPPAPALTEAARPTGAGLDTSVAAAGRPESAVSRIQIVVPPTNDTPADLTDAAATTARRSTLAYIESSAGLNDPTLEGGRTELEFGDVNGDGHPDILSIGDHGSPNVNTNQHGITLRYGDGRGSWLTYQNGRFGYGGIALGDANGDRLMDVGYGMHHNYSTTDFGNQLLEVALGDGTGLNWTPWDDGLATNGETYGMFETDFADIDNDGDLDLGSVSFGCCNGVHVYRNRGDGTWTQSFARSGGNTRNNFVFGDVNGDGRADLASGHQAGTVYFGDGRGGFAPADGNLPVIGNFGRVGVALGDVTADGRDEVAFVNASGGLAVWMWIDGAFWFDLSGSLPATGRFEGTQIADMNLDGLGDLVAYGEGRTTVYSGLTWDVLATFDWPVATRGLSALRTGTDLDHNGYPDLGLIVSETVSTFTSRNRFRVFLENTPVSEAWVYPKSPRGGETFVAGSTRFLDWHAAVPRSATFAFMYVELSVTGLEGPWTPVAEFVPNSGRFQWRVPADLPASADCYLRYILVTDAGVAFAQTPSPFTILPAS